MIVPSLNEQSYRIVADTPRKIMKNVKRNGQ
jgi:hypothetical protein